MSTFSRRAEWQWSFAIPGGTSPEAGGPPRAFLWIPAACTRVRAVVVGQHAMQEETLLEHPTFRAALADLDFAAIWISPPLDPGFDVSAGAGAQFDALLAGLARESGYDELVRAPVAPLGHSAAASFPWNFLRWAPERTLAALSISGQWPTPMENASAPLTPEPLPEGVPGLVTIGEYEWAHDRAAVGLLQRRAYPRLPLTMLGEAGGGHFDVSDAKVAYLALYLRKAAAYRLPRDTPAGAAPRLVPIDPTRTGWSVDRWRADEPTRVPAAPVDEYAEPEEAFWCFDEEHAVATEKFALAHRGKRASLPGFLQDGAVLPQVAGTHEQVAIPFRPRGDELALELRPTFLDMVPAGRPERWTGLKAGSPIGRPGNAEALAIERICGPVARLADGRLAVRFGRGDLDHRTRRGEIWLAAIYPGDRLHKRSVQQAVLRFPVRNERGAPQRIAFAPIPDQPAAGLAGRELRLAATSDAGAPVQFFVREGPAFVEGDRLHFTALPPRARRPVRVTVVAWQWGRATEPALQSATPVERSFLLT